MSGLLQSTQPSGDLLNQDFRSRLRMTPLEEQQCGLDKVPGVVTQISPNDVMYRTDPDHYYFWGRSAIRAILWVLYALGKEEPRQILDLPSGHGRVLRSIKATFPSAALTAADVDRDGVDFCSRTFQAKAVYAAESPSETKSVDRYDLVWCGSLVTHFDAQRSRSLLERLGAALSPGGILIFTTHGPYYRSRIADGTLNFSIASARRLVLNYDKEGFGYQDYLNDSGYGISASSPEWISRTVADIEGLELGCYASRGWGGFQDVYGCTKCS